MKLAASFDTAWRVMRKNPILMLIVLIMTVPRYFKLPLMLDAWLMSLMPTYAGIALMLSYGIVVLAAYMLSVFFYRSCDNALRGRALALGASFEHAVRSLGTLVQIVGLLMLVYIALFYFIPYIPLPLFWIEVVVEILPYCFVFALFIIATQEYRQPVYVLLKDAVLLLVNNLLSILALSLCVAIFVALVSGLLLLIPSSVVATGLLIICLVPAVTMTRIAFTVLFKDAVARYYVRLKKPANKRTKKEQV